MYLETLFWRKFNVRDRLQKCFYLMISLVGILIMQWWKAAENFFRI